MKPIVLTVMLLPLLLTGCSVDAGVGAGPDGAHAGGGVHVGANDPTPAALPPGPGASGSDAAQVSATYPALPQAQVAQN